MDDDRLKDQVNEHGKDIQALTVQVTKIAGMVENAESRRVDDVALIRDTMTGIKTLNDRMAEFLSLQTEVSNIKADMAELKADTRVNKHDIVNIQQGQGLISIVNEKVTTVTAKVDALEVIRDRTAGGIMVAGKGFQLFWAVFGIGIVGCGTYLIREYLHQ